MHLFNIVDRQGTAIEHQLPELHNALERSAPGLVSFVFRMRAGVTATHGRTPGGAFSWGNVLMAAAAVELAHLPI